MAESAERILVVDDERFFREAISEVLEDRGYTCDLCEDGETALELCEKGAYSVVILDIRLPGIDGIEVLRNLQQTRPHTRAIMLSASTDQELVLDALRLGACDYLGKPLHDEELVLAVQRAASSHGIEKDWGALRTRLDRLAAGLEGLVAMAKEEAGAEREVAIADRAASLASELFQAGKTSLMRLDEAGSLLEVVSMVGRDVPTSALPPAARGKGAAWIALQRGAPLLVDDISSDERVTMEPDRDRYDSESFAIVPLQAAGSCLGALCLTDRTGHVGFESEDLSLLRVLALQVAALLLENGAVAEPAAPSESDPASTVVVESESASETAAPVKSESESESEPNLDAAPAAETAESSDERGADAMPLDLARDVVDAAGVCEEAAERDSEIARQICEALVTEVEPARLLAGVVRTLERDLHADPVGIYLLSGVEAGLVLEAGSEGGLRQEREQLARGRGLTGAVLQARHLIATSDPSQDPRFDPEVDTASDGQAGPLMCIPLRFRGKVVGIARIHLAEGASASARTGEILGSVLSAAVRNVLLYRSLIESMDEVAVVRREARG